MTNTQEQNTREQLGSVTDYKLINNISQFYYREARLLDARKFQQWMALLDENIHYLVPTRHTPTLDPKLRETEEVLNIEQELSSGLEAPLRDDNYLTLMIRATRSFKLNAWADNPPARTRRLVSNIEVINKSSGEYSVFSNTLLTYSRHEKDNHLFTYQREDTLLVTDESYKIKSRNVVLDWNIITGPSVSLIF